MEQVTQQRAAAATAEESAAIGGELHAQAANSIAVVQQLERLAGRSTSSCAAPVERPADAPVRVRRDECAALRPTGSAPF